MIKQRTIQLIILTMVLALSGLIAIQIYWIRNALELEQQRFESTVSKVLQNVTEVVERQEVASNVRKRFDVTGQGKLFFMGIDSLIRQRIDQRDTTTSGLVFWNEISPGELQAEFRQLGKDGTVEIMEEIRTDSTSRLTVRKMRKATQSGTSRYFGDLEIQYKQEEKPSDPRLERFLKKSGMVSDIFKELFNLNMYKGVEDRINPLLIDSILHEEFETAGIEATFEFGVYDFINNRLFIDHPTENAEQLLRSKHRVRLFPHDIFNHPDYLLIYFPNENQFLMNNLWLMFSSSGLFILIIIAAFYFTINTILKQKKLSEIKNDFINNMTHELKTPISTISLACEALSDPDLNKNPTIASGYTKMIRDENKRLNLLVESVLQSALLDKADFNMEFNPTNIHQMLLNLISSQQVRLEKIGAQVHVNFKAVDFVLPADQVHLLNTFSNMLDNALKYSPKTPEITISTENQNDYLIVKFIDNGIGISRDQQKRVFEKLYRVPTGNIHNVKGFGLGLSYVKTIIEKHNGFIQLDSEPGKGSTFAFVLPLQQESIEQTA